MATEVIAPQTDKLLPDIITPEGLEVAECYLANGSDSRKVSSILGIPVEIVDAQLKNPEVKGYINRMFNETGFRNRDRLAGLLDQVINMKIEEMAESEIGSSMDIMDMLKIAHGFKIQETKLEIDLIKAKASAAPTNQTNIQVNQSLPGADDPNYMNVLDMLTGGKL